MPKKEKLEQEKKVMAEVEEPKKKTIKKSGSKNESKETPKKSKSKESKKETVKVAEKKQGVKKTTKAATKKKTKEEVDTKTEKENGKKSTNKTKTKKEEKRGINSKKKNEKEKVQKNIKKDKKVTSEVDSEQKKIKAEKIDVPDTSVQDKKVLDIEKVTTVHEAKEESLKFKKMEVSFLKSELGKKEFRTLEVVVLVLLTCAISLIVGIGLGLKFEASENIQSNDDIKFTDESLQNFIKEYNYLIENYYGAINKDELLNTAIKSMIDSLDDSYTGSLDETTSNNLEIELDGAYDGLGIEIINDENNDIFIYNVIPNSPASKVDLQVNDKLVSVNGTNVTGMITTNFINDIVKGSGARKFSITIERNGTQKTVEVTKNKITLQSVHSKVYKENGKTIGYIHASVFAANTYEQFKSELTKLENQGIDSLIIDLRDNNGGHLTAVTDMISIFLDSSHVIYQTQTKTKTQKIYSSGKETKKYPIVIIGNALSASASEVMIGALTEEYGAVLIGNQTFGKGTVQELHTLSNGDEYKLTTKKWLTPKGVWVHNNGIKPTIEVTLAKEFYSNPIEENDNQLKAALDYLKN